LEAAVAQPDSQQSALQDVRGAIRRDRWLGDADVRPRALAEESEVLRRLLLAERMSSSDFTRLMGRFLDTATSILVDEGAMVDKFVGDEVIGLFIPAMATEAHPQHAVRAARRLLAAMGHDRSEGPWLPIGIGVNSDIAYVGSVGTGLDSEMTAMGDAVNLTARLSSHAGAGEILLPVQAAKKAGVAVDDLEHRSLVLKGKSRPTEVVVLSTNSVRELGDIPTG
jgi:adenylate cyclase